MRALPVVVLLLLPGCLASFEGEPASCAFPELATLYPPGAGEGPVPRAPGEAAPMLYWARNPMEANATLVARAWTDEDREVSTPPPRDALEATHDVGPGALAFGAFAAPAQDLAEEASLEVSLHAPEAGCAPAARGEGYGIDLPREAPRGAAGKGVLVHTAGFWTNGTSFYTNHEGVHARDDVPKSYLGEHAGSDPLKVYVYDADRSEMPRRYQEAGYYVTIPGFNEALKGIPQGGARVAILAPEDAYTAPGREDHPLYGDALVFWIEAVEVVDLPCPLPQPQCDLPATPPLPPVPPLG